MKRPLLEKASSFLSSLLNSIEAEMNATERPEVPGALPAPGPVRAPGPALTSAASAPTTETTLYLIDNSTEKTCLTDKHPDVVAVTILAGEFAQLINNRNFEALDGRVEYHLYSEDYLQEVENKRDEKTTVKYIKKNKIKSRCESVAVQSMDFNEKMTEVEVLLSARILVTEAADKFFKSMNKGREGKALDRKVPYTQLYKLSLIKEQTGWKISNFEADSEITVD